MTPPDIDRVPIRIPGPKDFWVEVMCDDRCHGLIVARFDNFDAALGEYKRLIKGEAQMRVVMRHRAHIYRNYIPPRLHNRYPRDIDYE